MGRFGTSDELVGAAVFLYLEEVMTNLTAHWMAVVGGVFIVFVLFLTPYIYPPIDALACLWSEPALGVVELNGGTVAVSSVRNEGTTVVVALPAASPPASATS